MRKESVPFRFEHMWLKDEGFRKLLPRRGAGFVFFGSWNFVFSSKMKGLPKFLLKIYFYFSFFPNLLSSI